MNKWAQALSNVIDFQFHLLLILTPLIFIPISSEIFEFNKMITVYLLTITIASTTIIRALIIGKLQLPRTPFDLPILAILVSRILSTIFSIDPHTSLWGYYSRFNEGLFSTLAYVILFYCFVLHFSSATRLKSIIFSIYTSGILVALWGIPGYFGYDLSCLFINHKLSVTCWQLDSRPTERLYSTMGQANWLAGFMAMIIPIGVGYIFLESKFWKKLIHLVLITAMYFSLTVAFSRGGTLGLVAGVGVLVILILTVFKFKPSENLKSNLLAFLKFAPLILASFLVVNLIFGTAFTKRPVNVTKISGTALERDSAESGQIRLIVWRAAIDIFKHYPLVGSGLETFAYSFNQFKPAEHNSTVEWEYIYNKAHNEYLNILATTGILGFLSLIWFIMAFFIQSFKLIRKSQSAQITILLISLTSAYVSFLTQNFVGFSVVVLSLLSFLIPAILASLSKSNLEKPDFLQIEIPKSLSGILLFTTIIIGAVGINLPIRIWVADYHYANANFYLDPELVDEGISEYKKAISFHDSPTYHNALAIAYTVKATRADVLHNKAATAGIDESFKALKISPYNLSYHKDLYWIYSELGAYKTEFWEEAYKLMRSAQKLAPTDPNIPYNQARALSNYHFATSEEQQEVVATYEKAISLKPNWLEPYQALKEFYEQIYQEDKAAEVQEKIKFISK